MALVTSFTESEGKGARLHPTHVEARYTAFGEGPNAPVFQISTGGSAARKIPGKVSQTIQLDRRSAEALWRLLGKTYGFK